MGVERCNHCYFQRKACKIKSVIHHILQKELDVFWYVPVPPFFCSEINLLSRRVMNANQVCLYFKHCDILVCQETI